jgi:hypothetical protein
MDVYSIEQIETKIKQLSEKKNKYKQKNEEKNLERKIQRLKLIH